MTRHCLYSDFSIGNYLFSLEEKPPPCEEKTYCTVDGCKSLCPKDAYGVLVSSCPSFCCGLGICLTSCNSYFSMDTCFGCSGMWFLNGIGVDQYIQENCTLDCLECDPDFPGQCRDTTLFDKWPYPKAWKHVNQTIPTCKDLGFYEKLQSNLCVIDCCEKTYNCDSKEACVLFCDGSGSYNEVDCGNLCVKRSYCDVSSGCVGIGFSTDTSIPESDSCQKDCEENWFCMSGMGCSVQYGVNLGGFASKEICQQQCGQGACCSGGCDTNPYCDIQTKEWCDFVGGTYRGDGTTCDGEFCLDRLGHCPGGKTCIDCGGNKTCEACCGGATFNPDTHLCCMVCPGDPDDRAVELVLTTYRDKCGGICPPGMSDEDCDMLQHIGCRWSGGVDICTLEPCPPKGACCTGGCDTNPYCDIQTQEWCQSNGGTYRGDGTTCDGEFCLDRLGHCPGGTCKECCDGSKSCDCPPTGACCTGGCGFNPACDCATKEWCDGMGGKYLGDGTTCVGYTCLDNWGWCPGGKTCNDCGDYQSCGPCPSSTCSGPCDSENPCPEGCYCCNGVCQSEPCTGACCTCDSYSDKVGVGDTFELEADAIQLRDANNAAVAQAITDLQNNGYTCVSGEESTYFQNQDGNWQVDLASVSGRCCGIQDDDLDANPVIGNLYPCVADNDYTRTCTDNLTEAACLALGGIYQGAYTTCQDGDCADTCCLPEPSSCQGVYRCKSGYFESLCQSLGGSPGCNHEALQQPTSGNTTCAGGSPDSVVVTISGVTATASAYQGLADACNDSFVVDLNCFGGWDSQTIVYVTLTIGGTPTTFFVRVVARVGGTAPTSSCQVGVVAGSVGGSLSGARGSGPALPLAYEGCNGADVWNCSSCSGPLTVTVTDNLGGVDFTGITIDIS